MWFLVPIMEYGVQSDRHLGFNHANMYGNYVVCISIKMNIAKYHLASVWATFQQYLALAMSNNLRNEV